MISRNNPRRFNYATGIYTFNVLRSDIMLHKVILFFGYFSHRRCNITSLCNLYKGGTALPWLTGSYIFLRAVNGLSPPLIAGNLHINFSKGGNALPWLTGSYIFLRTVNGLSPPLIAGNLHISFSKGGNALPWLTGG